MRPHTLLLLLLALASACATTDPRASRVERARFLEARGLWLEAGEVWQSLVTADRGDGEAVRGLARALEAQGDAAGALAVLSGARDAAPEDATLRDDLGARLERLGRLEEAFAEYRAAAAADPDWAAPRRAAGALGLRLGEVGVARESLEEAALLEPGDAGTRVLLARARGLDGDPEGALEAWAAAAARAELTADDALRAGRLARQHAEWIERAEPWVARARARAPQREDLHRLHGELLEILGRDDESVAALTRALEADPGDVAVLEELARARARRGEPEELAILVEHARALGEFELVRRLETLAAEAEPPESPDETDEAEGPGPTVPTGGDAPRDDR